jgi:hypothetical protein
MRRIFLDIEELLNNKTAVRRKREARGGQGEGELGPDDFFPLTFSLKEVLNQPILLESVLFDKHLSRG